MSGKTIHDMKIGDEAEFTKTVSETDVYLFAGITGDFNPAHMDEEYSKKTYFKKRIAHGMLSAGFISSVLGTKLPGPGAVYMKQELSFLAPVYMGDTITARAKVTDINTEKNRVSMKTTCTKQDGTLVIDGSAVLSPRKV
ncbi:MAG: MaoC family dehydratase [Proteobacteria bacterium]|nr:MaoC family dehydratase [Pseudomonadota bacterium]